MLTLLASRNPKTFLYNSAYQIGRLYTQQDFNDFAFDLECPFQTEVLQECYSGKTPGFYGTINRLCPFTIVSIQGSKFDSVATVISRKGLAHVKFWPATHELFDIT